MKSIGKHNLFLLLESKIITMCFCAIINASNISLCFYVLDDLLFTYYDPMIYIGELHHQHLFIVLKSDR
jgi:hypothetical protein